MAEVLITLAVVGVVASMTIPTLINKHREQVTVAKVKKFYSTMSNAYLLSVKDNGYANEWDVDKALNSTTANQIAGYLKPYLKIIKDCGTSSGCLNYKNNEIKFLNGNNYNGNYDVNNADYKVILSDGSYVWWQRVNSTSDWCTTSNNVCMLVYTDINGGKAPNTIGKDIFYFNIKAGGVAPSTENNCKKSSYGWGCSGYIMQNGNMDYLH